MTLYQCLLLNNPCLKAGRPLKPRGIVVHSTGANNPPSSATSSPTPPRKAAWGKCSPRPSPGAAKPF